MRITKVLIIVLLLISTNINAKSKNTQNNNDIDIPFTKFTLDNGLTLIVHEDHKSPIVAINIWYHIGSKNEKFGRTGFAHLFEHLMFNGSENFNDDWFKPMDRIGATGLNGTTNQDRTNYFETIPKNALDVALWLESDRMGHLLGAITQERLDEQRGVVKNEKRQGENQPYGKAFSTILKNVYPQGHPYSWSVIGSMEDLSAASLTDVKDWFSHNYGAANATIVLAGDISPETALQKVKKYFGDIDSGPPLTHQSEWVAKRTGSHKQQMYDRVPQARVYKVWNVPGVKSADTDYLSLVSSVLSADKNSRLYKRLVYDEKIASDIETFSEASEIGGLFGIIATALKTEDLPYLEQAIDEEVQKFLKYGLKKEELDRVKTDFRVNFIRGLEKIGGFGGKSDILASNQVYNNDPGYFKVNLERIANATPKQLQDVAQKWLSDGEYQLEILPFAKYTTSVTGVDRSKGMPEIAPADAVKFTAFQKTTLSNGLRVIVAQRHAIPIVRMRMMIDSGYAADQFSKPGTANLTMEMLDDGTAELDALEISDIQSKLGTAIWTSADLDVAMINLNTLSENLKPSLDLFSDIIINPSFPLDEFKRLKEQQLAAIKQEKSSPFGLAFRIMPKLIYGEGHAYSAPFSGSGDEQSVASMTVADLKKFYGNWFKPNNATLIVTGDTSIEEITPLLEKAFKSWEPGETPKKVLNLVNKPSEPILYLIDRPDSGQSAIINAQIVPKYGFENEMPLQALNEILGGSFNARMNMNLREDKHWSYGASTIIQNTQAQRAFISVAPVQADKTAEAITEIYNEIAGIIGENPATTDELARAMDKKVLTLPGRWETSAAVERDLANMVRFGLSDDYWNTYPAKVRSVNLNQVNSIAKELLNPDRMIWMIVGDMNKVAEKIEALKLGKIIYLDKDGKVIKP
ncbi:MAG TPA: insulinase family protein [Oceanospirillales bacterium]|nr:insulinase family protein [Oceanospirillales bacterium]